MDSHISFLVVNSENACELVVAALERHHGAVEYRVAARDKVARDNGVCVITPYYVLAARGLVLPRDIGEGGLTYDL